MTTALGVSCYLGACPQLTTPSSVTSASKPPLTMLTPLYSTETLCEVETPWSEHPVASVMAFSSLGETNQQQVRRADGASDRLSVALPRGHASQGAHVSNRVLDPRSSARLHPAQRSSPPPKMWGTGAGPPRGHLGSGPGATSPSPSCHPGRKMRRGHSAWSRLGMKSVWAAGHPEGCVGLRAKVSWGPRRRQRWVSAEATTAATSVWGLQ